MMLMSVLLPAPFGPMSAATSPLSIAKRTSFSACRPPKRLLTALISSLTPRPRRFTARGDALRQALHAVQNRMQEPLRQIGDDRDQEHAIDHYVVVPELLQ